MTITRRPVEIQWEGITIPMGDVEVDDDPDALHEHNLHYACAALRRARTVIPVKHPVDEAGKRESPRPIWTDSEREAIVTQAIVNAQNAGVTSTDVRRAMMTVAEMQGELRVLREAMQTIRGITEAPDSPMPTLGVVHLMAEAACAGMVVGFVDGKLVRGEPPIDWFQVPVPAASTLRLVTG